MKVVNVHQRELSANEERVGALIDSLSSEDDRLWPTHSWPRMKLDGPLRMGASGGHGPIGYVVAAYKPGKYIQFQFTRPKGFNGFHSFQSEECGKSVTLLRHTIEMTVHGSAVLTWPLITLPLHDALLEDALATAQASLGMTPQIRKWPLWVKWLRWVMSGGKASSQMSADNLIQRSSKNHSR